MEKEPEQRNQLSLMTKLAYGLGDIYGGGAITLISMYYLFFLTDVIKIGPALAGTAILISRIVAAVLDPVMGVLSDNTRTRWGRRRPYFLAGIPLVFFSFVLMWVPINFAQEQSRFLYVLIMNLFFIAVFSFVWVPYNSIAPDLTSDYHERTQLATWRMAFSNIAGILAATLSRDLFVNTLFPEDPQKGFFIMAIAFGLFFSLPFILTFIYCKETPHPPTASSFKWDGWARFTQTFILEPFRLRPFRAMLIMFLFSFMAQDAVMAMAIYFLTCYLKINSMMTLLIPTYAAVLLIIPITEKLSKRFGKKNTFLMACFLWIVAFTLIPMVNPGSTVMVYLFGILFGASVGALQVLIFAMIPDVPDADELFSHRRREGMFFGILAMARKTGGALALFLIGAGLQLAGYLPPVGNEPQQQTAGFLTALFFMFIGIPLSFMIITMIACFRYPLTSECHARLNRILAARSEEGGLSETERQEESELRALLGQPSAMENVE
ncbi:MAG TPA: glycoside-pentoside-hexuronide (GPH):cation symporter [Candidatus Hydrogenedentes bacterium]|nr:glycoside-pentoside-hexuronide (GPH):cation symporter [Candidatus Hydrogenedentota bacterium]